MKTRLMGALDGSWARFSRWNIALRIPAYLLAWPLLLGLYIFSRSKNGLINIGALLALAIFLQIPWLTTLADIGGRDLPSISKRATSSASGSPTDQEPETSAQDISPVVNLTYGAVTTSCKGYFMTGTLEVTNSGNVPVSGRAEIPVSTYEKFMIPLSGTFLNLPPDSTTVISLEGGEGCKKGQVVGKPTTVFTLPNQNRLETLNQLDAFEWSAVKVTCDSGSGLVRLKATARNTSEFLLTAGIQGFVENGPLTQTQKDAGNKGTSYFGTIYKLGPGETREIDFGYAGNCIKGRKGFDGPYTTEFETRFTY